MEEIRNDFHNLANCLNNISINAGIIVETVKLKDIDGMGEEENKGEVKRGFSSINKGSRFSPESRRDNFKTQEESL